MKIDEKRKVAVTIGRFQPFHNGHEYLIRSALEHADRVIVLVGSSRVPRTTKNPWSFAERKLMIQHTMWDVCQEYKVDIEPLIDYPYSDDQWVAQVQRTVSGLVDHDEERVILVGHKKDETSYYLNHFPQWDYIEIPHLSINESKCMDATRVRELLFENELPFIRGVVSEPTYNLILELRTSEAFDELREDFEYIEKYKKSWAQSPFPPVFVTVDNVVVQSGHILMIKRGANPGRGTWALPGGFINSNELIEDAAIRELVEETSIKVQERILRRCIKGSKVFDNPTRSLRGRTITHAYLIKLDDNESLPRIKAADDASLAWWLPVTEVENNLENIFEDHASIINEMLKLL